MKHFEFISLPRLKNEDDFSKKLKTGDRFLYGPRMIGQIESKKPGQDISFYRVYKIEGKKVEYGLGFAVLQKN